MNDQEKELFEIRKADLKNPEHLAYSRQGYGANVIPGNTALIEGKLLPMAFLAFAADGQIIGRTVIGFESDQTFWVLPAGGAAAPWLYAVFVEPKFRSMGIGQALINRCLEFLAAYGFSHICLDSNTAGDWYVKKFDFVKSHSGTYDGATLDIYYRGLVVPPAIEGTPLITTENIQTIQGRSGLLEVGLGSGSGMAITSKTAKRYIVELADKNAI